MQPSAIFASCSECGEPLPGARQAYRCRCARDRDPQGTVATYERQAYAASTDFEARYYRRKAQEYRER